MRIVITGKSGVGKSEILKRSMLNQYIVMDDYVKEYFYTAEETKTKLVDMFGDVLTDGNVDFKKLGAVVLTNKAKFNHLEQLTLPFIYQSINHMPDDVIVELPIYLVHEAFFKDLFGYVIEIERDERMMDNKFTYLDAIHNKEDLFEYKPIKANTVIENNGDINDAVVKFDKTIHRLLGDDHKYYETRVIEKV